jgi:hypothetical protein
MTSEYMGKMGWFEVFNLDWYKKLSLLQGRTLILSADYVIILLYLSRSSELG